jgi:hypothetical protein
MPFTLSHAAAAIPFRRTRLIMSALVVGCFVPDFSYLLSLEPHDFPGHIFARMHSFAGMFAIDLPVALAALWLFHAFIRQPMLLFLSSGIRRRLTAGAISFAFWPWRRLSLIVLSILIGTATHLVWDAFTHDDSWIFQHWAFLREVVQLPVIGGTMQMSKLLEYASSVVGLAIVAVWIGHWYRTTQPAAEPAAQPAPAAQWRALVVILPSLAILGGALRAWHKDPMLLQIRPIVHFTADTLISAITFFLLGLLICGLFLRDR